MPDDAVPHASVLGRILLLQSTLHATTGGEQLASAVCRGLQGIPGVAGCAVCLEGRLVASSTDDLQLAQPCIRFLECGDLCPERVTCPLEREGRTVQVPLMTAQRTYGGILFRIADKQQYVQYEPYLRNTANLVALHIENQQQASELSRLNESLEDQVQTRTRELQEASHSLKFAQYAMDHIGEEAFWIRPNGRMAYVNEAACRALGYDREELLQMSIPDIDPTCSVAGWAEHWRTMQQCGFLAIESTHRTKDGREFPVDIAISHVVFGDEEYICAFARDITQRKQTEAERERLVSELEVRNAELERFVYTVSHDLKTPLITISWRAGLLGHNLAEGNLEDARVGVERITEASQTMVELLNDVLELSRIGRVVGELEEVSLAELTAQVIASLESQIHQGGVRMEVSPELPVFQADRTRLREVLQNLIENAIKFSSDQAEPHIEIGARQDGEETVCFVRDNGIGVAPRFHEKIFGLFDQLDPRIPGTGIGLTTAKRIIEVHNGRLWCESDGTGHGSTFCFTMPTTRENASFDV